MLGALLKPKKTRPKSYVVVHVSDHVIIFRQVKYCKTNNPTLPFYILAPISYKSKLQEKEL